jgi:hypothetical protein
VKPMRKVGVAILMLLLVAAFALISAGSCYSRIIAVELLASNEVNIDEEISVQVDIHTGNNLVEFVHQVQAELLLPTDVRLVSGVNPVNIGEMGPGPANVSCVWNVEFEEPGEYLLMVNASCINTQYVAQWMNASTTIQVYAPPHVEFDYTPRADLHVNDSVTFDAFNSYARGPDAQIANYSWDFGDGTSIVAAIPVAQHIFRSIGNFTVSLNVTDNRGLYASSATEIAIGLFGDLNFDGRVDIIDITIVAYSYGSRTGDARWREECDLNHDGIINIIDLSEVAQGYGKTI